MYDVRDIIFVFPVDDGWTWERYELDGGEAILRATEVWRNEQAARNSALDEVGRHGGTIRIERPRVAL